MQQSLEGSALDDDDVTVHCADTPLGKSPMPSTEAFYDGLRHSATARVVLPENEQDLERAALRLLQRLTPTCRTQLDRDLHEHVLLPRGGLHGRCMNSGNISRSLAEPLVDDAIGLLGQHLPIMDVAQILGLEFGLIDPDGTPRTRPAPAENCARRRCAGKPEEPPGAFIAEELVPHHQLPGPGLAAPDGWRRQEPAFVFARAPPAR